jgi:hypothetical protein
MCTLPKTLPKEISDFRARFFLTTAVTTLIHNQEENTFAYNRQSVPPLNTETTVDETRRLDDIGPKDYSGILDYVICSISYAIGRQKTI